MAIEAGGEQGGGGGGGGRLHPSSAHTRSSRRQNPRPRQHPRAFHTHGPGGLKANHLKVRIPACKCAKSQADMLAEEQSGFSLSPLNLPPLRFCVPPHRGQGCPGPWGQVTGVAPGAPSPGSAFYIRNSGAPSFPPSAAPGFPDNGHKASFPQPRAPGRFSVRSRGPRTSHDAGGVPPRGPPSPPAAGDPFSSSRTQPSPGIS